MKLKGMMFQILIFVIADLVTIQSLLKETGGTLMSFISLPMQHKYDKYWDNIDK